MYNDSVLETEDVFVFQTSFAQQRLWLLDQLQPGDHTYNISAAVRLRGPLDVSALARSLNEVVARHESLRTTFAVDDGRPVQVVKQSLTLDVPVLRLGSLPEAEREAEFQVVAAMEAQRAFDLATGPLLRAVLVELGAREHVLLLNVHHIVSDGWSMGVLVGEVGALYAAFLEGRPSPLEELPIQYADFSEWQAEWLRGEVIEKQLDYWRRKLEGAAPVLELPADRPRPPARTFRSASHTLPLSTELSEAVRAFSRRRGVTPFMTLLAAFKVLLGHHTGQEDLVVGSPIAGRNRAETRSLVGCFLNTLVLRTDLSGEPTFEEVLGRVRETTVGAYAHQDLPFERLLAELQTERDLSRTPLFQVFFNMLNLPGGALSLPGLEVEFMAPPEVGAKFDLTLYVREPEGRFSFEAVYNADLFAPERVSQLLEQFAHLLSQALARPDERIGRYSLVTASAAMLLPDPTQPSNNDWQGAAHTLFSEQARRAPGRVAVSDESGEWSYGELEESSNRLANCLRAQGVGRGDVVAIYGHRSASLVWALLGTLKSGAVFVILDPAYPAQRIADYLKLAEPRGLIQVAAAGPLPDALEEFVATLSLRCRLTLPTREEALAARLFDEYPATDPCVEVGPEDLAYLAFTSGSTGRPKGVEGMHGPLTHFVPWMRRNFGLDADDRYSMLSGLSHDPLQRDIFMPLALGARICIPSQGVLETQGRLAHWMEQERVTISNLTPAMAQLLTEPEPGEAAPAVVLNSLRYAFVVGDVLTRRDVTRLKSLAPTVACINLYGATETQRALSYFDASDLAPEGKEILPLGKGIEDVQLLVVNKAGARAGVGELGEIYIRSPHIARGYLNDAALTAEKFVVNPFSNLAGDRLYRTGDLGRYLPDGAVEPLGRADHQVKVRGFRIEPGEIEAVLGGHAQVREAVVVAREDEPGNRSLVAYLVLETEAELSTLELRGFLHERLPDYMVPSQFVVLDKLPLTPNLKVDRRALPAPPRGHAETSAETVQARTPVERRLAEIWAEVLKLERVGADENFFGLGGHSLLAIRCLARVREEFEVEVPLRRLFESPTVAGLAACVEELRRSEKYRQLPPLVRAARDAELPLSFAQQRLWFLDQLEPDSPVYNIHTALRLDGRLDADALQRTLDEIIRRHEVLRTSFHISGERPVQIIAPSLQVPVRAFDLGALPEAERESEARRLAADEARLPFDLSRGPLLRACLIRLAEREHLLLIVMHHIISDGWSMGVLAGEVAALYGAFVAGETSKLQEPPVQYADFACWQREWLEGEALASQLDYWKRQLSSLPLLQLPGGKTQAPAQSNRGSVHFFEVNEELTEALRGVALREGATLFMTLLAAFKALLHRHTGQTDVVVGTDTANRFPAETEQLIGFFVNQLVLRTDLSGAPSFSQLLGRVRAVTLSAYEHQDVPFDRVVGELRPDRAASRTPLFQAKLVLQNSPLEPLRLPGVTLSPVSLAGGTRTAKFDLLLTFVETGRALSGSLEYSTDIFDATGVERLANQFVGVLRQVADRPDAPLSELELFTEEERRRDVNEETARAESKFKKFKAVRPKAVSLQQGGLVKKGHLNNDGRVPLVVEPAVDIIDLAGWVANNRQEVTADLYKHGAILFRGFKVPDQPAFSSVVDAVSVPLMNYVEGATPRTQLGGKIYTSTEYPADQSIALHNELTYVTTWPMKLWFYCSRPADQRGETPIADVRNVLRRIPADIRRRFAEKGWMLVRNFGEGLSLPWQTSFHLDTKEELEAYCHGARIECEWKDGDRLQTRQVRPALATHPTTGEEVWFNHVAFWHVSSLEPQVREAMLALFGEENLAYNTFYGDGTPIEDSVVAEIRDAYKQETVEFPWQHGDVLMIENMLVAHGRNPFVGPRKILVAMGEGFTRSDF
ncbi:MAG TPA: amino acid adenylation domain-containing protein [Pyrinomonadaceae bacterium]